jgi:hypothetical protein
VEKHQIRSRGRGPIRSRLVDSETTNWIPLSWLKDPAKTASSLNGGSPKFFTAASSRWLRQRRGYCSRSLRWGKMLPFGRGFISRLHPRRCRGVPAAYMRLEHRISSAELQATSFCLCGYTRSINCKKKKKK